MSRDRGTPPDRPTPPQLSLAGAVQETWLIGRKYAIARIEDKTVMDKLKSSHRVGRWAVVAVGCCVILIAALAIGASGLSRYAERRARAALQNAYGDELEIQGLHIHLLPTVRIAVDRLVLHQKNRQIQVPLISIERVSADARIWDLLRSPLHIHSARLQKLEIHVPPRRDGEHRFPQSEGGKRAAPPAS